MNRHGSKILQTYLNRSVLCNGQIVFQRTILPISLLYGVHLNQAYLIMTRTKLVDVRWELNSRNIQLHKTVKRE